MDVSKLFDELEAALAAVDQTKAVVDSKQAAQNQATAKLRAALDAASSEVAAAVTANQQAVDAANVIRETMNAAVAEKLGDDPSGRVRS